MSTEPVDPDSLPPLQQMALDVLAARYRLGEPWWTFSTRVRPALLALESASLVSLMHGTVERTFRASLTEAGRALVLSDSYWARTGVTAATEWGVRYGGEEPRDIPYGSSPRSEQMARLDAATDSAAVVRRTVTYGPWEVAPCS